MNSFFFFELEKSFSKESIAFTLTNGKTVRRNLKTHEIEQIIIEVRGRHLHFRIDFRVRLWQTMHILFSHFLQATSKYTCDCDCATPREATSKRLYCQAHSMRFISIEIHSDYISCSTLSNAAKFLFIHIVFQLNEPISAVCGTFRFCFRHRCWPRAASTIETFFSPLCFL